MLKAMAKDPAGRYATAQELADDLGRFLKDEPIRARRPSLAMRARKFMLRNRPLVIALGTALALFLVAAIVALAVSNHLIRREEKQKSEALLAEKLALVAKEAALKEASQNLETANAHRRQAESRLSLILAALDEVYITDTEGHLHDYLYQPGRKLLESPRQARERRAFLQKGLGFYERLLQSEGTEPLARYETGRAYRRVGALQLELGEYDKAGASLEHAIALLDKLVEEFPAHPIYRLMLADAHCWQGRLWGDAQVRRLPEAVRAYGRATALADQLVAEVPIDPVYRTMAASFRNASGCALIEIGQPQAAEAALLQAVKLWEQLVAEHPAEGVHRADLADTLSNLAWLERSSFGQSARAEPYVRRSLAFRVGLLSEERTQQKWRRTGLVGCRRSLGEILMERPGSGEEAERSLRVALSESEGLARDFPQSCDILGDMVRCRRSLAALLARTGRLGEAEQSLRRALKTCQELTAESGSAADPLGEWVDTLVALASVLEKSGRRPEALEIYRQATSVADKLAEALLVEPADRMSRVGTLVQIPRLLHAAGQPREADRFYQRTVEILERQAAAAPHAREYRDQLAHLYLERGWALLGSHRNEAEQAYRRAIPLAEQLTAESPEVPAYQLLLVESRKQVAWILVKTGRPREAEALCRRTLPLAEKSAAEFPAEPDHRFRLAGTEMVRGLALKGLARPREAEDAFRRAIAMSERLSREFSENVEYRLQTLSSHQELNSLLAGDRNRPFEVEVARRREREFLEQAAADFPDEPIIAVNLAHRHRLRGFSLQDAGRLEEAEVAFRQAMRVLKKPAAESPGSPERPGQLLSDTYASLGNLLAEAGRGPEATEAFRKALAFPPSDAVGYNHLAWVLATCPDERAGDGRRAVELARKAVELAPNDGEYWNTLGAACCRTTDWKAAIEALEKANALGVAVAESISNASFLAMAHGHLGHKERARHWYERAVSLIEKYAPEDAHGRRLRAEMEKVIDIRGSAQSGTPGGTKPN